MYMSLAHLIATHGQFLLLHRHLLHYLLLLHCHLLGHLFFFTVIFFLLSIPRTSIFNFFFLIFNFFFGLSSTTIVSSFSTLSFTKVAYSALFPVGGTGSGETVRGGASSKFLFLSLTFRNIVFIIEQYLG